MVDAIVVKIAQLLASNQCLSLPKNIAPNWWRKGPCIFLFILWAKMPCARFIESSGKRHAIYGCYCASQFGMPDFRRTARKRKKKKEHLPTYLRFSRLGQIGEHNSPNSIEHNAKWRRRWNQICALWILRECRRNRTVHSIQCDV